MKEPVVVAHSDDRSTYVAADHASGWKYLFLLGLGLMVVGLINVGTLFFPPRFASLDWEFGTIAGVFEGMPLITIGIGTMSAAAVANGWVGVRRALLALTIVMTLIILVLGMMFLLDIPGALAAVQPAMRGTVTLASVKTSLMALTYFVLYLALGVWTWRRQRATSKQGDKA